MSPTRSRTRTRRVTRKRRRLIWARSFNSGTTEAASVDPAFTAPLTFNLLSTFETNYGANLVGITVMRIRGHYAILGANTDTVAVRAGIRVGDGQDFTTVSSDEDLYNPATNGGAFSDWMSFEVMGSTPGYVNPDAQYRLVDVRSMRKIDELGQQLGLQVSGRADAAEDFVFAYDLSILLALP